MSLDHICVVTIALTQYKLHHRANIRVLGSHMYNNNHSTDIYGLGSYMCYHNSADMSLDQSYMYICIKSQMFLENKTNFTLGKYSYNHWKHLQPGKEGNIAVDNGKALNRRRREGGEDCANRWRELWAAGNVRKANIKSRQDDPGNLPSQFKGPEGHKLIIAMTRGSCLHQSAELTAHHNKAVKPARPNSEENAGEKKST